MNVFFPGIGQLIQGRFGAFVLWWVLLGISAVATMAFIGFITTPILWIWCIIDAARYDPR